MSKVHWWGVSWEAWQLEILRAEWTKGSSASVIGGLIGKSRNAVLGKRYRLKLPERAPRNGYSPGAKPWPNSVQPRAALPKLKPVVRPKPIPPKPVTDMKKAVPPKFYPDAKPIAVKAPIGIMELRDNTCRAIVGRGPDGLAVYCGDMTFAGQSYCEGHCAIYFNYDRPRRRA